ncbi:MAG: methylmalonyl-CoA epimerase [Gemmatimonadetes bacterium]|nr:methylmalonyl-CoA epimerase [Gemmatimonadota bacterium]
MKRRSAVPLSRKGEGSGVRPRIAHIGVAVTDLSEAIAFYRDVLGIQPKPTEKTDGATIVSLPFGDVDIELLQPDSPDTPVGRFLSGRGPGIHHVCFRVPHLEQALERCRALGFRLVDEKPRVGAEGRRIAFLHPKTTAGILLELTE